ncbi:putative Pumilio-family RNA-binding protein [Giardia muris]|uniref:Putative Pumilio-family RNA-binding protein n=1 Tax=Giardia muris TaxID=5742 RepID=A0A4Z1T0W1_GIAMU|nr:putative Pumilio-family RNA-binding protein [Giardia muris]|eukprot:TNJ27543.1 putative Pumilio-family RNA-binding protein [Giardia muris]
MRAVLGEGDAHRARSLPAPVGDALPRLDSQYPRAELIGQYGGTLAAPPLGVPSVCTNPPVAYHCHYPYPISFIPAGGVFPDCPYPYLYPHFSGVPPLGAMPGVTYIGAPAPNAQGYYPGPPATLFPVSLSPLSLGSEPIEGAEPTLLAQVHMLLEDSPRATTALQNLTALIHNPMAKRNSALQMELVRAVIQALPTIATTSAGVQLITDIFTHLTSPGIIDMLTSSLVNVSTDLVEDQTASRLLQLLLVDLPPHQLLYLCQRFRPKYLEYCNHKVANHLIQKLIETLSRHLGLRCVQGGDRPQSTSTPSSILTPAASPFCDDIGQALEDLARAVAASPADFSALAVQTCGCRIYQKLFTVLADEDIIRPLEPTIIAGFVTFAMDQWANFCAQSLLSNHSFRRLRPELIRQLKENTYELASNKFGSHVVECFISTCTPVEKVEFCVHLYKHPRFPLLMKDRYGNFVVQRALSSRGDGGLKATDLCNVGARVCLHHLNKPGNFDKDEAKHIVVYLQRTSKKYRTLGPLSPDDLETEVKTLLLDRD